MTGIDIDSDDETYPTWTTWLWIGGGGLGGVLLMAFMLKLEMDLGVPEVIVELGYYVLVFAAIGLVLWWQQEEVDADIDPAFEGPLDVAELRRNPDELESYRELVDSVCIIRMPRGSGHQRGGADSSYESFAIDVNGETHTIAEGTDWAEVEKPAQWLADQLDVPYRDETYG